MQPAQCIINNFFNFNFQYLTGDNLKFNSKVLCIFAALLVVAVMISAACAADLLNDSFKNENFAVDVPSGSNFSQSAVTEVNVGEVAMKMIVFENSAKNCDDAGTIIYLEDTSDNKNVISEFINDLRKDNEIVEENNNYTIVKTKNSNDFNFFNFDDIENGVNSLISGAEDIVSSEGDINFSADGNNISLSDKGLEITDADGEIVSISGEGIQVSGSASGGASADGDVMVEGNLTGDIHDSEYVIYLKNPDNSQVIAIAGNNPEVLKAMADTASFK